MVDENVSYHRELEQLAESLKLSHTTMRNIVTALNIPSGIQVLFLLSVPSQMKTMLLNSATLLLYTPSNEHFGIVPLEAMLAGLPVLAVNTGGPLETIVDSETGWLKPSDDVNGWTEILRESLRGEASSNLRQMGRKGKARVKAEFSERKMAERLNEELESVVESPRKDATELPDVLLALGLLGVIATVAYTLFYRIFQSRR